MIRVSKLRIVIGPEGSLKHEQKISLSVAFIGNQ